MADDVVRPMGLREIWGNLRDAEPGHRFRDFEQEQERRRESRGSWRRVLWVGGGILLLLAGLAIGWLPGPGGFVSIIGAGMLATQWRPVARLLDRAELIGRSWLRWLLRTWRSGSTLLRMGLVSSAAVVVAAVAWVFFGVVLG